MTATARIPAIEVTGPIGSIMKVAARRMLGKVPDSLGVLWHYPAVFTDMMGFNRKAEKWDRLDENLSILARMASAAAIGCNACLDINYFMAHRQGLDEVKVREVPRWRESTIYTTLERAVMAYAHAMSQTPVAVTDELSAELLDALGPAALIELTARVGLMNLAARTNIALGIHSEEYAAACGLPALATSTAALGSVA
ncbi:carboxymuconolactone decarboxylase family protein [Microbacterium sulfonylureivorans]|uniref:carboxymuconolactone decarboxylase family protein n=1 Tax=Microbacterium sulfonylureivorans TaxID=2486854 RepID=UPI000FDA6DAE|nr:carboxymuconolactone decarboxylase family protein [Microbacterium sulfonylureivorans]